MSTDDINVLFLWFLVKSTHFSDGFSVIYRIWYGKTFRGEISKENNNVSPVNPSDIIYIRTYVNSAERRSVAY